MFRQRARCTDFVPCNSFNHCKFTHLFVCRTSSQIIKHFPIFCAQQFWVALKCVNWLLSFCNDHSTDRKSFLFFCFKSFIVGFGLLVKQKKIKNITLGCGKLGLRIEIRTDTDLIVLVSLKSNNPKFKFKSYMNGNHLPLNLKSWIVLEKIEQWPDYGMDTHGTEWQNVHGKLINHGILVDVCWQFK